MNRKYIKTEEAASLRDYLISLGGDYASAAKMLDRLIQQARPHVIPATPESERAAMAAERPGRTR